MNDYASAFATAAIYLAALLWVRRQPTIQPNKKLRAYRLARKETR